MQFFYWNKSFEIGIVEVDLQHRRLVDIINSLAAVIVESGKLPEVQMLFSQLMQYATTHFHDEELIMAKSSLAEGEKRLHLQAHREFVEKAKEIILHPDLLKSEVSQQVLEFLTTWLISHILGSDKKIARALANDGVGACGGEQPLFEISPVERLLLGALTETERRFRLISDHTPVLIWVSDATGDRGFINKAWNEFIGVKEDSVNSMEWAKFIHDDDREAYLAKLNTIQTLPQPAEIEYRLRHYNGNYHWFLERILPRMDADNVLLGFIASSTDISGIKQAEVLLSQLNKDLEQEVARRTVQLEQQVLTDPLTGVGNRRMLTKRLEEEVMRAQRYQRPLSVAFFDIDHFKKINDTHGHSIGDMVLTRVAESFGSSLRDCDLLGRFGGEEFVVLLPETTMDEASKVAERMRVGIARMRLPQVTSSITVSAGLAELQDNESGEDLLERSDRALYRAKAEGRNCCRIDGI